MTDHMTRSMIKAKAHSGNVRQLSAISAKILSDAQISPDPKSRVYLLQLTQEPLYLDCQHPVKTSQYYTLCIPHSEVRNAHYNKSDWNPYPNYATNRHPNKE